MFKVFIANFKRYNIQKQDLIHMLNGYLGFFKLTAKIRFCTHKYFAQTPLYNLFKESMLKIYYTFFFSKLIQT